jgi:hypothetical protein
MHDRSILAVLSVIAACACACGSGGNAPPMPEPGGGGVGGGTAQTGFCGTYCGSLVASGTDCQHYNDANHCNEVCTWYRATVCIDQYSAFATCVQTSGKAGCYLVTATGKWGLYVPQVCQTQYDTFVTCKNANGVGICPYGN